MNHVTWYPSTDADIASYDVERASSSSGPWTVVGNVQHDLGGASYDQAAGLFFLDDDASPLSWYRLKAVDQAGLRSVGSTPFQPEGATFQALTSLDNLKAYLSKKDAADDTLLTRIILAASRWFESQVGRTILQASYTDTKLGDGGCWLVTRHYPVTQVDSLVVDGQAIPEAIGAQDDGFRLLNGAIYLRGYRLTDRALVECSYQAGFPSVPGDIEQAVIEVAANSFKSRDRVGVMSKSMGGESVSFVSFAVPVSVQTVIDTYRRVEA